MSRDEEKIGKKSMGLLCKCRCQGKRQRAFHGKLTQIEDYALVCEALLTFFAEESVAFICASSNWPTHFATTTVATPLPTGW